MSNAIHGVNNLVLLHLLLRDLSHGETADICVHFCCILMVGDPSIDSCALQEFQYNSRPQARSPTSATTCMVSKQQQSE